MQVQGKAARNNLVDVVRLICAILVVSAHVHLFEDISHSLAYTLRQTLPRFTVLYFFAIAGYFYCGPLLQGKCKFRSYMKRLLVPYAAWSLLYVLLYWFSEGRPRIDGAFLLNRLVYFCTVGCWEHLWYFPSLFLSVILATAAWKIGGKKGLNAMAVLTFLLFFIGCMGCGYFNIGTRIPILKDLIEPKNFHYFPIDKALTNAQSFHYLRRVVLTGPPFFLLGYLLKRLEPWWRRQSGRRLGMLTALAGAAYVLEYGLVTVLHWKANGFLLFTMYPLILVFVAWLFKYPLPGREKLGHACLGMANFTYYAHELIRTPLLWLAGAMNWTLTETPLFALVVALSLLGGWLVVQWNRPWLNRLVI